MLICHKSALLKYRLGRKLDGGQERGEVCWAKIKNERTCDEFVYLLSSLGFISCGPNCVCCLLMMQRSWCLCIFRLRFLYLYYGDLLYHQVCRLGKQRLISHSQSFIKHVSGCQSGLPDHLWDGWLLRHSWVCFHFNWKCYIVLCLKEWETNARNRDTFPKGV